MFIFNINTRDDSLVIDSSEINTSYLLLRIELRWMFSIEVVRLVVVVICESYQFPA